MGRGRNTQNNSRNVLLNGRYSPPEMRQTIDWEHVERVCEIDTTPWVVSLGNEQKATINRESFNVWNLNCQEPTGYPLYCDKVSFSPEDVGLAGLEVSHDRSPQSNDQTFVKLVRDAFCKDYIRDLIKKNEEAWATIREMGKMDDDE